MEKNRKNIIVNEILYWKKSRMLPDQYCDYLLTLYTEGNQPKEIKKEKFADKIINFIFLMLIPISVFLVYFTELSIILQISFFVLLVIAGILTFFYYSRKGILPHVVIVCTALILLFSSVEVISGKYSESPEILYLVLIVNCFLWLFAGWKLKLFYFSISGLVGFLLIIISIFV